MPFEWKTVSFPFGKGLAEHVTPSLATPGTALTASDCWVRKEGSIEHRPGAEPLLAPGYARWSAASPVVAHLFAHTQRQLTATTPLHVAARSEHYDAFVKQDRVPETNIARRIQGERGRSSYSVDSTVAYANGILATAWYDGTNDVVGIRFTDYDTGAAISLQATTGTAAVERSYRLVVTGERYIHLAYSVIETAPYYTIRCLTWDTEDPTLTPASHDLCTDSTSTRFDACGGDSTIYLAYEAVETVDPETIVGDGSVILWCRSDTCDVTEGDVTSWTDLTGNGHHFTSGHDTLEVTYSATGAPSGKPALQFTRGAGIAAAAFALAQPFTVLISAKWTRDTEEEDTLFRQNAGIVLGKNGVGNYHVCLDCGTVLVGPEFASGAAMVFEACAANEAGASRVAVHNIDAVTASCGSTGLLASGLIWLGYSITADIYEIIVVNRVLTTSERAAMVAYMATYSGAGYTAPPVYDDPIDLLGADLYAWLRSDTVTTAGSSPVYVDQFTDKSGNSRHWTRDRGYPEYKATGAPSGNATVCVTKVPDGFGASWSIAQPWTLLIAGKWTPGGAGVESVVENTAGSQSVIALSNTGARALIGGDVDNPSWATGTWHTVEVSGTGGADSRVAIDLTDVVTGTLGGTLAVNLAPGSYTTVFEFTEVVAASKTLNSEERARLYAMMETYMNG